jgi:hypothetical protein
LYRDFKGKFAQAKQNETELKALAEEKKDAKHIL